jgi:transposase
VARTGIAWEYLPHDFPPAKTVYDYYAKWEADGTTQQIHDVLREQVRASYGRRIEATAAVVDAQSVKTSGNVPETGQGIDAAKKIKGRKRHIATDTLGLLLAVIVGAASVQDSAGGRQLLDVLAADHASVAKVWVDGGYNASVRRHGAQLGMDVQVVPRLATQGFHVLPRRWAVERTFGC